ncbi:MAG TPA: GNAT family N-acetyltransferase [Streptosporangiaceae bacterium]|nr:GNAT family N-acetyltransferase [Streptosporangiaceae bacterium]
MEWHRGEYTVTDDLSRMDVRRIHQWLSQEAYWSLGRSIEDVAASLRQSRTYAVLRDDEQVGVGRAITDGVTFAYLCDVFVAEPYRNQEIGGWLLSCMLADLRDSRIRQVLLATRDAHSLYRRAGFHEMNRPERWLELDPATEGTTQGDRDGAR